MGPRYYGRIFKMFTFKFKAIKRRFDNYIFRFGLRERVRRELKG